MKAHLFKSLVFYIFVFWGVLTITFLIFNYLGLDPALSRVGKYASPEKILEIQRSLNLQKNIFIRYFLYIQETVSLNFGRSWSLTNEQVIDIIQDRLLPTILLMLPPLIFSNFLAILIAVFSITSFAKKLFCYIKNVSFFLYSLSSLFVIIFLQYLFSYKFSLFPPSGYDYNNIIYSLTLPWLAATIIITPPYIILFQNFFMHELNNDYIRTAKAKGLNSWNIHLVHILKNCAPQILTIFFHQLPHFILGSIVLESFFAIPGLGSRTVQAINELDFPVIQALTTLSSLLYIFFNIISDFMIKNINPRINIL